MGEVTLVVALEEGAALVVIRRILICMSMSMLYTSIPLLSVVYTAPPCKRSLYMDALTYY